MNKHRINRCDLLVLSLTMLLLTTAALHIAFPKSNGEKAEAAIEIRIEKLKCGEVMPTTAVADGRFKFKLDGIENGVAFVSCTAFLHNAGVMSVGGKLLCPNQPISLANEGFYMQGRITKVRISP